MHVAVIASDPAVARFLSAAGFTVMQLHPNDTPSLTALLFDHPELSALVIQDDSAAIWSASHVLAAAKHLERKGPTILLGGGKLTAQCGTLALVKVTERKEEIPDLLRRPPHGAAGGHGITEAEKLTSKLASVSQSVPLTVKPKIRPMRISPGSILVLGVIGSQPRIGCTTQAIGLWHYCKALGLDPAIVAASDQIAQLASVMECKHIEEGCVIEGIPFVSSTALAYDCYIVDIGASAIPEAKKMTDCLVLVAGSKPWELEHTARALRSAKGRDIHVLLSFTSQKDADNLQPLFGGLPYSPVPYMTDPWKSCFEAMLVYDTLLRPVLERLMSQENTPEEDRSPELIKGGY